MIELGNRINHHFFYYGVIMKVYLSGYRNHWISPFTIIEKVVFWREIDFDEPKVKFWVNVLEPFCEALQKFLDFVHPQITYVKIDKWDTWNMDSTLAKIILPMLKQLKESKHGAPFTYDEDVPEELRSTSASPKENAWDTDDNHFKRWDWIMNEMIWTFEQLNSDWESQFSSGEADFQEKPIEWDENGKPTLYSLLESPTSTYKFDSEGYEKCTERITNGLRLFGKYYRGLWD